MELGLAEEKDRLRLVTVNVLFVAELFGFLSHPTSALIYGRSSAVDRLRAQPPLPLPAPTNPPTPPPHPLVSQDGSENHFWVSIAMIISSLRRGSKWLLCM